jgi:hypothetical protein
MADRPPDSESKREPPGRGLSSSTPRWARWFWISVFVLILAFVIVHLAGGGLGGHHGMGP